MKNIAIIPARSGSKGLKDKNIAELDHKPLLSYSIEAAQKSGLFKEIMVSTDSEKYAEIAMQYGAKVPFLRSSKNSSDTAGSWDMVEEVLTMYRNSGETFDTICLLQPTSPLRKALDIINAYDLYSEKGADSITSVCEMEHSPLWATTLSESLSLKKYRSELKSKGRRQDIDKYYRINGAIYIRAIDYMANNICLLNENEYAYIMNRKNSVDIDVKEDFEVAEFFMSRM